MEWKHNGGNGWFRDNASNVESFGSDCKPWKGFRDNTSGMEGWRSTAIEVKFAGKIGKFIAILPGFRDNMGKMESEGAGVAAIEGGFRDNMGKMERT
jgi:hypothetical protein